MPNEWPVVLARCSSTMERIRTELPSLPEVGMEDFTKTSRDTAGSTVAALRTVELCIRTLRNCVFSTVRFAREYPIQIEDLHASDVVWLLDVSVDLIEPASQALTKAAKLAARNKRPKDTVNLDLELVQRVFGEQAAVLQKWKEKHREDIEVKLVEKSPAKLASVADAIENIAKFLRKLNLFPARPVTVFG